MALRVWIVVLWHDGVGGREELLCGGFGMMRAIRGMDEHRFQLDGLDPGLPPGS